MIEAKQNRRDDQAPHTGKMANNRNKVGEQPLTELNEGKRTPISRDNCEAHIGSDHESQSGRGKTGHRLSETLAGWAAG